jgi:hypothetical protein
VKNLISVFIILTVFFSTGFSETTAQEQSNKDMIENPQKYLKITDWQFYVAARVAIIHHVKIENTADIDYKNLRVKVYYYSNYPPKYNTLISSTSGVLPITVPANSSELYLEGGTTLGAGSMSYTAKNIKIIGVEPVLN